MFPFQPSDDDELVFGNPSFFLPDKIWNDVILDYAAMDSNIIDFSTSVAKVKNTQQVEKEQQQRQITRSKDVCNNSSNNNNRRVSHRDIERKRRQEMSILFASLRNLLPLEHIKGKRSICDHMHEAVNYIKHAQKNIEELQIRRDKLKKLSDSLPRSKCESSNGGHGLPHFVLVNMAQNGLEILIQSCTDFGISRVLSELLEKDVNVISCVSTKTNEVFLHKILAEAIEPKSFDPAVLQERLRKVITD